MKNQKAVQEKLELSNKEMAKDVDQSAKHAVTLENELIQQSEKYAKLKKSSQQLQYQIDNLKISKEQQTLSHQEKLKEYQDIESELEHVKKVVHEKDIALTKYVTQND